MKKKQQAQLSIGGVILVVVLVAAQQLLGINLLGESKPAPETHPTEIGTVESPIAESTATAKVAKPETGSAPARISEDAIRQLIDNGYLEIVLTGVDMTSYGSDLPGDMRLGRLVRQILSARGQRQPQRRGGQGVPGLHRLLRLAEHGLGLVDRVTPEVARCHDLLHLGEQALDVRDR